MTAEQIWGIARTILAAGGGFLVAKGYVSNEVLAQILGAMGTLFVAGWSVFSKRKSA